MKKKKKKKKNQAGSKLAPVSEAEVRAAFTARLGMPLTGQMLPGTLPFYPSLTVIEGDPAYIHKQMQSMEQQQQQQQQQQGSRHSSIYGSPITDTQVAHARLHKAGHRPLGSMFTLSFLPFPVRALPLKQRKKINNAATLSSLERH